MVVLIASNEYVNEGGGDVRNNRLKSLSDFFASVRCFDMNYLHAGI